VLPAVSSEGGDERGGSVDLHHLDGLSGGRTTLPSKVRAVHSSLTIGLITMIPVEATAKAAVALPPVATASCGSAPSVEVWVRATPMTCATTAQAALSRRRCRGFLLAVLKRGRSVSRRDHQYRERRALDEMGSGESAASAVRVVHGARCRFTVCSTP